MAENEHKNLRDSNRHFPMGYESANNQTVLSKGEGSTAQARDGALEWAARSTMGVTNYKMQGYTVGKANFQHGEDVADARSPYQMDVDYGSSAVASGSLQPAHYFRIGQGYIVPENANVSCIDGWITSSGGALINIALCKITPNPSSTSNVVPIVIDQFQVRGESSNNSLVRIDQTSITTPLINAGDIIFPMISEILEGSGSTIYVNLSIQTMTFTPQY